MSSSRTSRGGRAAGILASFALVAATGSIVCGARADTGAGTRAHPFRLHRLGQVRDSLGWRLRVDGVTPNADELIRAETALNHPPRPGRRYFLVHLTVVYTGRGSARPFEGLGFYAVGRSNRIYDFLLDTCGLTPDVFNDFKRLSRGKSVSGNLCVAVKTSDIKSLVLLVEPGRLLPGTSQTFFSLR
ncbi:MAG TPA: hypothetical protein VNH40_09245 [Gaiellaceae bacterium]|nr:hypothetical protein [Gaiellaceae bacterium]